MTDIWIPHAYTKYVEGTDNPMIREQMRREQIAIARINDLSQRIVIDVGCGYGRLLPLLAIQAKEVIGLDIDEKMLDAFRQRAEIYSNVKAIKGDATDLPDLLPDNVQNPVVLCTQNTLGTIKGSYTKVLDSMIKVASQDGDLLLTLFSAESFSSLGREFYTRAKPLVGEIDLRRTDFEGGRRVFSKTGYIAQWWRPEEVWEIMMKSSRKYRKPFSITLDYTIPYFFILHAGYYRKRV